MTVAMTVAVTCVAVGLSAVLWWAARRTTLPKTPRALETSQVHLYRVLGGRGKRHIGIVTGDLRRARCAQVWVNPENTGMRMARVDEFSVSAIIRYEGAHRDTAGRVTADLIADELDRRVGSRRPVPAGTAIITGAGELARFGVRYVAHSAAVQGEPGAGFRQVREVGRCVTAVLAAVDRIADPVPVESVLFPLLGTGQGGGDPSATATALVGAAVDYFAATPTSPVTAVYLLAYTDTELAMCRAACKRRALRAVSHGPANRLPITFGATPATGDTAWVLPPAAEPPTRKMLQMGFTIDVVGFGSRSAPDQEAVERRLADLLRRVLADTGTDLNHVDHQWHGDGASVYLPSDIDPTRFLAELIGATTRHLAEDNQHHPDRIRLRMAVTVGLVGQGATGYSGPIVVDLARMVDALPLRQAVTDQPNRDLAVLLSEHLYSHVVRPGYAQLPAAHFRRVAVAVKEFTATAWLWVPPTAG
jgi:O-acetyl-ADP-ribose deacetylase (regulator of RNase III)